MKTIIGSDPLNPNAYLVYSDWLEQNGMTDKAVTARLAAQVLETDTFSGIAHDYQDTIRCMILSAMGVSVGSIISGLANANGRRRMRTLDIADVFRCCMRAAKTCEWQATGGGTVANAYGYQSWQTVCIAAVSSTGRIVCRVGVTGASKGSSLVTWAGDLRKDSKPEVFTAWADARVGEDAELQEQLA